MQCSKVTRQEVQAICLELLWFFVWFFFYGFFFFGGEGCCVWDWRVFFGFSFFFLLRIPNFTGRMNNYILRQIDMHAFCKNV